MSEDDASPGPLAGLDVIDFGHYFAAPIAAMLLADQGANVVRVLAPDGPELPDPQHRVVNRIKKIVTLDLRTQEGRQAACGLAEKADVAIESFRPGVMAGRGLDHATLAKTNPGLIYLSLPGFASTDSERAGIQAWEGVVSAASALYTTGMRQRLNFPPLYVPAPICSTFAAMHGAIAVLSALAYRDRTGRGTCLEVPLVNAGISTCTRSFVYDGGRLRAETSPPTELPPYLSSLVIDESDDKATRRTKLEGFSQLAPPIFTTHRYRTADDRQLLVMPIKPEMAERFFEILGLTARLKAEAFVIESPWERYDLGLGNNLASSWTMDRKRSLRVIELASEAIAKRDAAHWESAFAQAGIPIAVIRSRAEWLATESVRAAGLTTQMDGGRTQLTVAGPVTDVSGPAGTRIDLSPREPEPIAVEEAEALFHPAMKTSADDAGAAIRKSELLAGLKVLDLCNVVAGPNAAYTLAQFGADVIRIEPPRSFNLPMHLEWTLEVNQGKRSTILDLGTTPGREVFDRLVRWADVIVHNRLDDVAERLGMSRAQLQAIHPGVVVCQNSAFGGPHGGPWDRVPGYDPMPNMTTGLDVLAGTPDSPRGMTEIFADLMGGLGTAFGGLLALHQLRRHGHAGEARSSLARGASYYQLPFMIDEDGRSDWGQGEGPDARGDAPWQRMYASRNGWIYVGTRADRREELARTVTGRAEATESDLEGAFAEKDVAHWMEVLTSADIGCHPVTSLEDLLAAARTRTVENTPEDEQATGALEMLRWPDHPSGLPMVLPAPAWVQVGPDQSYRRLAPTPKVGEHTCEVLAELGYSESEIERLLALRVAHEYLPAIGDRETYFFRQQKLEKA
jgi:crotonobetainyl-CoA:carnitine CoA-transferase CaiB-like acyl-CoA transferase